MEIGFTKCNRKLLQELLDKKFIDIDAKEYCLLQLRCHQKIVFKRGNRLSFCGLRPLSSRKDNWTHELDLHSKKFQLIIEIDNCEDRDVTILERNQTVTKGEAINFQKPFS